MPAPCRSFAPSTPPLMAVMGLQNLGVAMFGAMLATGYPERLQEAYNFVPAQEMVPAEVHD
ncbi:hypothetical protein [Acidocella sp.]|uniref:hypothetical protein n=1 Tax=Acidocella sp. TaxID=50710 RepID=UPI002638044D|nr:hypothetical protein [Acidocella sp.]